MNGKQKRFEEVVLFACFLLASLMIVLSGCKKEPEPAPAPPVGAVETASAAVEQKTCPVMGNPIDKNVYTEYKGKKVYFCCPACAEKFKADPEKYVAKLPQFKD